jgi:hypothetical protein
MGMRRSELEARLRALGWLPTDQASGVNHRLWAHPTKPHKIAVPNYELIWNSTAERILDDAER